MQYDWLPPEMETEEYKNAEEGWDRSSVATDILYKVCRYEADGTFHVGSGDGLAKTIYCQRCGGKEFNVGTGEYFTAVKCVKCLWERCVHEG